MIGRRGKAAPAGGTLALLALCLAGAFASACGATPPRDPVAKEIPEAERERLLAALDRAMSALPPPPPPFEASAEDSTREADRRSYWDPSAKRWAAPARATLERVFIARPRGPESDLEVTPPDLEYRVFLNHEPALPPDLASAGGEPRQFPLPGTVAVEVTLIGAGPAGGRVAVPLSPEEAAMAPTVIRIYIGNREMESAVRLLLRGGQHAGSVFPSVERAGGVRSIVIDFYGPKRTVESLAPALDVAALRKLLPEPAGK